mmetsp:Transcript_68719/g.201178  ORF Transcript_68719/g.201178 Transcript_68719/m.201178 type:complete len:229 (+) Transcript_68719:200-886(+)
MLRGRECARQEAPAGGVGGGSATWMKVFCTEKPMCPSVQGVSSRLASAAGSGLQPRARGRGAPSPPWPGATFVAAGPGAAPSSAFAPSSPDPPHRFEKGTHGPDCCGPDLPKSLGSDCALRMEAGESVPIGMWAPPSRWKPARSPPRRMEQGEGVLAGRPPNDSAPAGTSAPAGSAGSSPSVSSSSSSRARGRIPLARWRKELAPAAAGGPCTAAAFVELAAKESSVP